MTELVSCLSPPRGHSRLLPVTVVRVAGHCRGVLGQTGTLGCVGNSVEPSFSHRGALPHSGAPLLLSALHASASAPIHSVYLEGRKETLTNYIYIFLSSTHVFLKCLSLSHAHTHKRKTKHAKVCLVSFSYLNQNECHCNSY